MEHFEKISKIDELGEILRETADPLQCQFEFAHRLENWILVENRDRRQIFGIVLQVLVIYM